MLPLLAAAVCAGGHPHMFIDTEMDVRLAGSVLEGLEITWYFDPMFTAAITTDFDSDRNGVFNEAETEQVYQNAFANLENSGYFTFVEVNGETLSPSGTEDFRVFMHGSTLVYRFFCPFHIPVENGVFTVAVYDSSFYCDILYREGNPISVSGSETAVCEIVQNADIQIDYGGPVSVSREGASYSGTAFPQQLVVHLN